MRRLAEPDVLVDVTGFGMTFVCFCCIKKYPLSATGTKMRGDLNRSRSRPELTSSWLICAWISEAILSQLIVDVAPRHWRGVNVPTQIPQIRCVT